MAKLDDTDEFVCALLGGLCYGFGALLFVLSTIFGVTLIFTDPDLRGPGKGPGIEVYFIALLALLGVGRFFFWLTDRSKRDR